MYSVFKWLSARICESVHFRPNLKREWATLISCAAVQSFYFYYQSNISCLLLAQTHQHFFTFWSWNKSLAPPLAPSRLGWPTKKRGLCAQEALELANKKGDILKMETSAALYRLSLHSVGS